MFSICSQKLNLKINLYIKKLKKKNEMSLGVDWMKLNSFGE
jgi:hypothetical protein